MKVRILKACCMALVIFITTGCAGPIRSSAHPDMRLSAWSASWDMKSGMQEYAGMKERLESLSYFAAYFNAKDQLVVPPEVQAARAETRKQGKGPLAYLTIVNDWEKAPGKATEKDLDVLRRVLANDASVDRHIAEILALAKAGAYDGIEIDYERFWKDEQLTQHFLDFTYRLSRAAIGANLKLRIVLEPSVPFKAGFCQGPQYVVMLYNLYGTHSGPGPKADGSFILKTLQSMEALPEDRAVAFATGGCQWERGGILGLGTVSKRFIDEKEAAMLQQKYQAKVDRDPDSAAVFFDYEKDGHRYTVWYADSETLNAWISLAANNGIQQVSLWRLGSNTDIGEVR